MTAARPSVAIVGAGPAGLFAAERLAEAGAAVTVYDRMASPARKFLLAGRGGLNLTHSESRDAFLSRYPGCPAPLAAALDRFPPAALAAWADGLGAETFIGSSGRVFPKAFKASPLLRAWLARLAALGVRLEPRTTFAGLEVGPALRLAGDGGDRLARADAVLLALGGGSWPKMGSDGSWVALLRGLGVEVADLQPSNMGVEIAWSAAFGERFAGMPLKPVRFTLGEAAVTGEAVVTASGLEGGALYALSSAIRKALAAGPPVRLLLDMKPGMGAEALAGRLARARPKDSLASVLKKNLGLPAQAVALLREAAGRDLPREAVALARLVKAVPLAVSATRPLGRAISSAGGVCFDAVTGGLELKAVPGVFVAGEMLDWEAPTGGYLLQATFATAEAAACAMARRLGLALPERPVAEWSVRCSSRPASACG